MPTPPASAASSPAARGGPPLVPALALMALAILLAALIGQGERDRAGAGEVPPATPLPLDGRSPAPPAGADERVLVRLSRPALGELRPVPAGGVARRYVASLADEGRALRGALGARGVRLTRVRVFGRTYPGFAATVPADELARLPSLGVRAEAVRRFFPAAAPILPAPRYRVPAAPPPPGPGADVALVDGSPRLAPLLRGLDAGFLRAGAVAPAPVTGRPEVSATSDEIVAALERAADPDGDGDPADHARVALVGLNAPYAGFADAPEARAADAAAALGMRVVAPAGNEDGPVGSPGGARGAVTVGARPAGGLPVVRTAFGPGALAGGRLPGRPLGLVVARGPKGLYGAGGRSRVRGRAVVLPAAGPPARLAALAAGAGARVLLLAGRGGREVAPGVPSGPRDPAVIVLGGATARAALAAGAGARIELGLDAARVTPAPPARPGTGCAAGSGARFSARGAYGTAKPDVLAPAVARTAEGLVAGTGVAAARVAAALARRPDAVARLRGPLWPGDGVLVCPGPPVASPPALRRDRRGRVDGVAIVLGRVDPGRVGVVPVRVRPVARLDLALLGAGGGVARLLTPPGGARDLLPGEYAYTLPRSRLAELAGRHAFRARVTAPGGATRTLRSEAFGR